MFYHYTTVKSLCDMLNTCHKEGNNALTFWASSAYTMNDPTEMGYAYHQIIKKIREYEEKHNISKEKRIFEYMADVKRSRNANFDENFYISHIYSTCKTPYLISFSENRDDMPMWQMYGDKGKGICLGFEEPKVEKSQRDFFSDVIYIGKEYEDSITSRLIDICIENECKSCYSDLQSIVDADKIADRKVETWGTLCALFGGFLKNGSYYYEHEHRFLHIAKDANEVKYRHRNGLIIPYVEIPIIGLKEIIIGPCIDCNIMSPNLKQQTLSCRLNVEINQSSIPYRTL